MASQNIFLGEDIRKQLPNESALFDQVNNNWKAIMDRMNKDNNALRSTHYPGESPRALALAAFAGYVPVWVTVACASAAEAITSSLSCLIPCDHE